MRELGNLVSEAGIGYFRVVEKLGFGTGYTLSVLSIVDGGDKLLASIATVGTSAVFFSRIIGKSLEGNGSENVEN